jgi:hypothetical protein
MKKQNKFRVEYLILMSIFILSLLVSCETPERSPPGGEWEYVFINKTQSSISITLDKQYDYSSSFVLYSDSSKTIHIESSSLGFQWDYDYNNANSKGIYTSVNGSKVTFEER